MHKAQGSKLEWVECGRGVAALAVVVSHISTLAPIPISRAQLAVFGDIGVTFFFALSGFIIAYVHERDIGHPEAVKRFAWRRLARILPSYYLILPIAIVISQIKPPPFDTHLTFSLIVQQLLLTNFSQPILGPSWTLHHELLFYAIFALLLVNRYLGLAALTAWFVAIAIRNTVFIDHVMPMYSYPSMILGSVNFYFLAGLALWLAVARHRVLVFVAISVLFFIALAIAIVVSPPLIEQMHSVLWLPSASAALGLLVWMSQRRLPAPRSLVWLGQISYVLYLSHLPLFEILHSVNRISGNRISRFWQVQCGLQLAIALIAASLLYVLFDRPVTRWLNRRGPGDPGRAPDPAPDPVSNPGGRQACP